jgi:hypothetical protein
MCLRANARSVTLGLVKTDDLTRDQIEHLARSVTRELRFFNALIRRMDECGFEPSDELHRLSLQAQGVLQNIRMHLHYATCASGVGRVPEATRP